MTTKNILIGTPCYGGLVTHVYMQSILKLMAWAMDKDVTFLLGLLAHDSLVPRSRNTLFAKFLDTPDATHLFFIDADIGFEPEAFGRLLSFDEDLVAGRYPIKAVHWPQVVRAVREGQTDNLDKAGLNYVGIPCEGPALETRDGFVTADYVGTGFMLMKRVVAERMAAGYPETHYNQAQTYPPPKTQSHHLYNVFDCMVDPDTQTYLSEDFTFCKRWQKLGGKIWLDQQSQLTHIGTQPFG